MNNEDSMSVKIIFFFRKKINFLSNFNAIENIYKKNHKKFSMAIVIRCVDKNIIFFSHKRDERSKIYKLLHNLTKNQKL